jgi:hypothetical protein
MSLNAWGGRLYGELAAFIAAQAPDVLLLRHSYTETNQARLPGDQRRLLVPPILALRL